MTLPPFEITGGLPLAFARGVSVAGVLSVFGTLLAPVAFLPAPAPPFWHRLLWASVAACLLGAAAWAWQVAATLADQPTTAAILAVLPVLLLQTWFGHVLLLRVSLVIAAAALGRWRRAAALLAGAAVATQVGHSHAFAMDAGLSPLVISVALHLLAAGAWLGGLVPLLLLIRAAPAPVARRACRRFSALGIACVVVLAGTALLQGATLVGSLPALVGTAYGLLALAKLLLFGALLAFAAHHLWRLAPSLATAGAVPRLVGSIGAESAVGLLVVLAAGVLSSLPPSMHTPVVWPFAWRPSLATVHEDADFRREVIAAALALAGAATLLLLAALLRRRGRWLLVAAALAIAWRALPHMSLLLVDAYPTSFQHSPTGFGAGSIARGAALYPQHCAACHGADGRGDGPQAAGLTIPPADLTAAHLWMHSDGELIWWLSHGIDSPEGGLAMPGFATTLPRDDLWALIDYVRARNAGLAHRATGDWPQPLRAPAWQATCPDGRTIDTDSLRGQVVRLVVAPVTPPPPAPPGVVTVVVGRVASNTCSVGDASVAAAYAVAGGLTPQELAGSTFLIDAQGWLRTVDPGGLGAGRPSADAAGLLARQVAEIRAHALAPPTGSTPMSMPMSMPM